MRTSVAVSLHVAMLNYKKGCSLKPPPGPKTFKALLERCLLETFVTSSEPLLVTQPKPDLDLATPGPWGSLPGCASIGFSKGQARSTTLLSFLLWVMESSIDLEKEHPELYSSVLEISAQPIEVSSRFEEAMLNMKISVQGSIRKANNVIQIVLMLQNLAQHGWNDTSKLIKTWNSQSGKAHAIVGKKAVSLKLLLEGAPGEALNRILSHVEEYGWDNCTWSDESLGNTK